MKKGKIGGRVMILKARKTFLLKDQKIKRGTLGVAVHFGNCGGKVIFDGMWGNQVDWSVPDTKEFCTVLASDMNVDEGIVQT